MKKLLAVIVVFNIGCGAGAGTTEEDVVANALDWYSEWRSEVELPEGKQTCFVRPDDHLYLLNCSPVGARLDIESQSGSCVILSIIPERNAEAPAESSRELRSSINCGAMEKRPFRVQVEVKRRSYDDDLSGIIRASARRYEQYYQQACVLFFPRARKGDPFAHVYRVCNGALQEVWEFRVLKGVDVEPIPHWTYHRRKRDLPEGWALRLSKKELWLDGTGHSGGAQ